MKTRWNWLAILLLVICTSGISSAQESDPFGGNQTNQDNDDPFAEPDQEKPDKTQTQLKEAESRWKKGRQRIKLALEQPTEVEYLEVPLEGVVAHLSEETEIQFRVDVTALDTLGLDTSLPITESVSNVPLREALSLLLKPYDLTYMIRDGYVLITSDEVAQLALTTRLYSVRDLLHKDQPTESIDRIVSLVENSIDSNSWEHCGGPGCIDAYQGILVVAQTDEIHKRIEVFVDDLRSALARVGGPTILLPVTPHPHGVGGTF